jgi:hypothetical protein
MGPTLIPEGLERYLRHRTVNKVDGDCKRGPPRTIIQFHRQRGLSPDGCLTVANSRGRG